MSKAGNPSILTRFKSHLIDLTLSGMSVKLIVGLIILLFFAFSDMFFMKNVGAFYTRLIPIFLCLSLIYLHFFNKHKRKELMFVYSFFLLSLCVMMYTRCAFNLNETTFSTHVTGTIMIIFLVSMELRTKSLNAALFYFVPIVLFTVALLLFFDVKKHHYFLLANIYPIVLIGYIVNVYQQKLRFDAFKSTYLLQIEKQITDSLFKETLEKNEELYTINEKLLFSEAHLKKAVAYRDRFFSIVAHDLRGPFSSLIGITEVLAKEAKSLKVEDISQLGTLIHESSLKVLSLLENLLSWSRSQTGDVKIITEKLSVKKIIDEVVELMALQAEVKDITIECDLSGDLYIKADNETIKSVFRNLVNNALKYTEAKGTVTINAKLESEFVVINVIDTGIGISPLVRDKLFILEESISTPGTKCEIGTGLGLLVCKEFVESNKGKISIVDFPNKGAAFRVELPAAN